MYKQAKIKVDTPHNRQRDTFSLTETNTQIYWYTYIQIQRQIRKLINRQTETQKVTHKQTSTNDMHTPKKTLLN